MEACVGDLQEAFKEVGLCCDWMLSGCGNISMTGHLNHLIYRKGGLEPGRRRYWEETAVNPYYLGRDGLVFRVLRVGLFLS